MSNGRFTPHVIIRSAVGSQVPLFPGYQHNQDNVKALKKILIGMEVVDLKDKKQIIPTYVKALKNKKPIIIIERPDLYEK